MQPVVLRPVSGARGEACLVEIPPAEEGETLQLPNLRFALPGEMDALVALLSAERPLYAEWHHLLGHHPSVRTLCERLALPYDVYVHDYAWFCARIALVGPAGRYCGEPDVAGCESCIAVQGSNLGEPIAPAALVRRSAAELAAARAVIAPSNDAARRIARHFPSVRPRAVGWEDDAPAMPLERFASPAPIPSPILAPRPQRARICVIGGIGVEKGYDVLLGCLADAKERGLPLDFVVVGHTPDDDALFEAGCLDVTGPYREDDAVALIRARHCDLAFLPSIWPETWCFTLGLAWRAGLAAACFDIGAQAERIRRTGRGAVLPLGLPVGAVNDTFLHLCRGRASVGSASSGVPLRMMS
jgi:glycosyltransferase involved in cell wall biosynthesis